MRKLGPRAFKNKVPGCSNVHLYHTLSLSLCENLHSSFPMETFRKTKRNGRGQHKENTLIINNGKQVDSTNYRYIHYISIPNKFLAHTIKLFKRPWQGKRYTKSQQAFTEINHARLSWFSF